MISFEFASHSQCSNTSDPGSHLAFFNFGSHLTMHRTIGLCNGLTDKVRVRVMGSIGVRARGLGAPRLAQNHYF